MPLGLHGLNADPEGGGAGVWIPPGKSQIICFLRKIGTEPLKKQLDTSGPTASRGAPFV